MTKTLLNDAFIQILFKSGGEAVIHELQIEGKTLQELFDEILQSRENASFYHYMNIYVDTGQIAMMLFDNRSYLPAE